MATIRDLAVKLAEIPPDWKVAATKSGASIEAWEPGGVRYCFIFTDDRPTLWQTSRKGRNSQ